MRAFSALLSLIAILLGIIFCWDGFANNVQITVKNNTVSRTTLTKMPGIHGAIHVFILDDYLYDNSVVCCSSKSSRVRSDMIGVSCSFPHVLCWHQFTLGASTVSSTEMSTKDAYIVKYPDMERGSLSIILKCIVPVNFASAVIVHHAKSSEACRKFGESEYGALIKPEVYLLFGKLWAPRCLEWARVVPRVHMSVSQERSANASRFAAKSVSERQAVPRKSSL